MLFSQDLTACRAVIGVRFSKVKSCVEEAPLEGFLAFCFMGSYGSIWTPFTGCYDSSG